MGAQALAAKRGQYFLMRPEDLVLIMDKKHPLYDERVELPPDEGIVLNMMSKGVKVPLKGRKNGESVEVVDGRRRTINSREANRRLAIDGREPLLVKVEIERGSDVEMVDTSILCNELRRGDDPITTARKIQRYLDLGRTVEDAALNWGVTVATVKNRLALLDLAPEVQIAVRGGRIGPSEARSTFGDLPREEQTKKIGEMDLPAPAPSGKPRRKKKKSARCSRPRPSDVRQVADAVSPAVREALLWAIGDLPSDKLTTALGKVIEGMS